MRILFLFAIGLPFATVTGLAEETGQLPPARNTVIDSDRPMLADAEAKKWLERFEKLLPKGWTVSRDGDVFTIERNRPVEIINEINQEPDPENETAEERKARDKTHVTSVAYRIKLRFAPKISQDQFEELAAENHATQQITRKFRTKLKLDKIPHKFDQYIPQDGEQIQRLGYYNDLVRKLPFHELPDCYAPDHSVFYQSGWPDSSRLYDKDEYYECLHVEHSLLRLFGVYSVALAKTGFPRWNSEPRDSAARRGLVEVIGPQE